MQALPRESLVTGGVAVTERLKKTPYRNLLCAAPSIGTPWRRAGPPAKRALDERRFTPPNIEARQSASEARRRSYTRGEGEKTKFTFTFTFTKVLGKTADHCADRRAERHEPRVAVRTPKALDHIVHRARPVHHQMRRCPARAEARSQRPKADAEHAPS